MSGPGDWNCDKCGRTMTPHGDCPSCDKKETARALAAGEIKRAADIVVGDVVRPKLSLYGFVEVKSVEKIAKDKITINGGIINKHGVDRFYTNQWMEVQKPSARDGKCFDDSCELSHCAKCGSHMMGGHLEHGTVCDSCVMVEEQADHVTCNIYIEVRKVRIYRNGIQIGVVDYVDTVPKLSLWPDLLGNTDRLSLNDLSIIMDNWNQMEEFIREGVKA